MNFNHLCVVCAVLVSLCSTLSSGMFFDPCWGPAKVFVTNISTDPLRGASSEGIAAIAVGRATRDRNTTARIHFECVGSVGCLLEFNGDSNAELARVESDNNGELHFKPVRSMPSDQPVIFPPQFRAMGYNHTGDVDSAGGIFAAATDDRNMLIAPISGWPNPAKRPAFFAINGTTLADRSDLFSCVIVNGSQVFTPWVAASRNSASFYSADYDFATEIFVYRVVRNSNVSGALSSVLTCEFSHAISLSMGLIGTQGGVVLNDTTLLIATNDMCIYSIDLTTGEVTTAACLWLPPSANKVDSLIFEMEGISLADLSDLGMGALHLATGDFARPRGSPRPVYHLEYKC